MSAGRPLVVARRPRASLAAWTVAVAAVAGLAFWFATSPPALTTADDAVVASTPVGQDVYVAVAHGEPERTLALAGVHVRVAAEAPVQVDPLLCLGGSPRVTSDPAAFCTDLVEPDGRELGSADAVLLRVRGDHAATVSIDRVRLAFRDGLRWGTRPAGAPAVVDVISR